MRIRLLFFRRKLFVQITFILLLPLQFVKGQNVASASHLNQKSSYSAVKTRLNHKVNDNLFTPQEVGAASASLSDDTAYQSIKAKNETAQAAVSYTTPVDKDSFDFASTGGDVSAYNEALSEGIRFSGTPNEVAQQIQEYKTIKLLKRMFYGVAFVASIILFYVFIKRKNYKIPLE